MGVVSFIIGGGTVLILAMIFGTNIAGIKSDSFISQFIVAIAQ
jgi:hypothetical protein